MDPAEARSLRREPSPVAAGPADVAHGRARLVLFRRLREPADVLAARLVDHEAKDAALLRCHATRGAPGPPVWRSETSVGAIGRGAIFPPSWGSQPSTLQ